jgi:uncharacterized protein (UPF0548 family)
MSLIATEGKRISNLVKAELWSELGFCREVVTVNEGSAKNYVVGSVLGKVTSGGKYKLAVETAVDGSKVFAGLVLENVAIPASTDVQLVVLVKGPSAISKGALSLDATYDNDTKKNVVYAAMETAGIKVLETA